MLMLTAQLRGSFFVFFLLCPFAFVFLVEKDHRIEASSMISSSAEMNGKQQLCAAAE